MKNELVDIEEFSVQQLEARLEQHGSGNCCCFCANGNDGEPGATCEGEETTSPADSAESN